MKIGNKKYLVYKSIKDLPIYNFLMVIKDNDLRFLLKNYDDIDYPEKYTEFKSHDALQEIWEHIRYSYDDFVNNKSERKKHILIFDIDILRMRYEIAKTILKSYQVFEDPAILWQFNDVKGFSFKYHKPIQPQLDIIIRNIKHLKNRLNLAQIKFEQKYLKEENKVDMNKVIDGLEITAQVFEIDLGISYKVDPRTTSVMRWLNLIKFKEQKDKAYEDSKIK